MLLQLAHTIHLGKGDMVHLRQHLHDLILERHLLLQPLVILADVACDVLHQLVLLDPVQHPSDRTEH